MLGPSGTKRSWVTAHAFDALFRRCALHYPSSAQVLERWSGLRTTSRAAVESLAREAKAWSAAPIDMLVNPGTANAALVGGIHQRVSHVIER